MRDYELYLVIDAEAEEDAVSTIVDTMTELISVGGEVGKVDYKGKRRLAYPLNKTAESQDIVLSFSASPQNLTEMERILKLDENVLRYLLVRTGEE